MPLSLKIEIIISCLLIILIILQIVRKGRISIKYSLVWLLSIFVMLISALIPNFMETVANWLGFELLSNMMISMVILVLIFVSISLTIIVSGQKEKIRLLIQEVSLLKEKIK
ncbi:MAG: DUF2304 domain-containing protein [Bacilli bacterium]|jgi:hypothetical protein